MRKIKWRLICKEGNHSLSCVNGEKPCDLSERPFRKAIYSGFNRSGICICGHKWDDHHPGMVVRLDKLWTDAGPEGYIPEECEYYGVNEYGGLDDKGTPHCGMYKDSKGQSMTQEERIAYLSLLQRDVQKVLSNLAEVTGISDVDDEPVFAEQDK